MTTSQQATAEPVGFDETNPGDRITFLTANNGYGSDGTPYERTGTILRRTSKTIIVECDENAMGHVAHLARSTWGERSVLRVEKSRRAPYDAHNVQYLDHGLYVVAIWVSDPNVSAAEAYDNLLCRDLPYEVEVIAEATRFHKSEGADFSGWVIRQGIYYTDPIKRKHDAVRNLRMIVAERFAH